MKASPNAEWQDFSGVRETLERWKLKPKGSPRSAVGQLRIEVEKVIASGESPVKARLDFLETHSGDVIVLAVHQHSGHMRWLAKSVGAPIARGAGQMTLFIPHGVAGFVSRAEERFGSTRYPGPVHCGATNWEAGPKGGQRARISWGQLLACLGTADIELRLEKMEAQLNYADQAISNVRAQG